MDLILAWLSAFVLTQCVEMGVYAQAHAAPRPRSERVAIAFACSATTHPLVWFVLFDLATAIGARGYWSQFAIAEGFAVAVEAALLAAFGVRWALAWSLGANACSVICGFFCYRFLAW